MPKGRNKCLTFRNCFALSFSSWQLDKLITNWEEKPVAVWFIMKMWQKLGSWKADKMIKKNELSHSSAVQKKEKRKEINWYIFWVLKLTFRSLSFENQTSSSSTGASGRLRSSRERDKIRRRDTIVDVRWGSSSGLTGMCAGFSVFLL